MDAQSFVVFVAWLAVVVLVVHMLPWVGTQLSATMTALHLREPVLYEGQCPQCGVPLKVSEGVPDDTQ